MPSPALPSPALTRWSWPRLATTLAICFAIWAIVALACLCVGSTGHLGWPAGGAMAYRREIVLLASLIGAALASCGVVYQSILRNPLADPYLLGVSSGAALAAYLWHFDAIATLAGHLHGGATLAASQQLFAFAGATVAVAIVFALASQRGRLDPIALLLVGVIVNSICGALYLLIDHLFQATPAGGDRLAFFVGGLQTSLTTQQETLATICIAIGWLILLSLAGPFNLAGLGDDEARSLGVRIGRLRWVGLIVASLVTASAVAISGPIGFVGLICPHLARLLVGPDTRKLLPTATALGAALLAIADAASRRLAQPDAAGTWLPVGVLTGLLGGPFFLVLLYRQRRLASSD